MAVTYNQVRQFALSFPGVVEGRAYGGPSLHVGRKFLGRLRDNEETLVLKINPAERALLLDDSPDAFFLTDHYRPYPYVLVNLIAVQGAVLWPLIENAWRMTASRKAVQLYDASKSAD